MAFVHRGAVRPRWGLGSRQAHEAKAFWSGVAFQSRVERPAEATVWGCGLVNVQKGGREAARGFPQPRGFWFSRHQAGERCLREARAWAKLKTVRAEAGVFPCRGERKRLWGGLKVWLPVRQRRVRPAVGRAARLSGLPGGTNGTKRPKQQGGVAPNRAFSGRGCAPWRPWRQKFRVESANGGAGWHAPPLTLSLGSLFFKDRTVLCRNELTIHIGLKRS